MSPKTLNPLTLPVNGTNLIEAGAGTGKTYNIAALFTRLVLLERQSVDKILVVTFTKAATAELKTRLRARLEQALSALKRVQNPADADELLLCCGGDTFLRNLLQRALAQESQELVQLRLAAAISNFDNAAIYTIHGFCQRVLQDFAFYCQVPFNIELTEDGGNEQTLTNTQDFWRTQIAENRSLAELLYRRKITPEEQSAPLEPYLSRPYLVFRQPENAENLEHAKQQFETLWQNVSAKLDDIETAFWALHANLNGNIYRKAIYEKKFAKLHQFSSCPTPSAVWDTVANGKQENPFLTNTLKAAAKGKTEFADKDLTPIADTLGALGEAAQNLLNTEAAALVKLSHELLIYLRRQNEDSKKHRPNRRFDDLLLDVFRALNSGSAHAQALAQAMAHNWHTALIDEFQDTDPLQYAIFQAAFIPPENAENRPALFMVGDPKQAIYSFRGADIFAYLHAARDADRRYTLAENYRSHAKLVQSINALFSRSNPFVLPEIAYPAATSARAKPRLSAGNAAVRLTWLNDADTSTADTLKQRAAEWCAEEIAESLKAAAAERYTLLDLSGGEKPLHAGQIAVLVRARKDGALMQRTLKKHGVQSVLLSRDSVFGEDEALSVFALLGFFLNPQRTQNLIFALSGCLFGYTAAQIENLNASEPELTHWTDAAERALQNWQQYGVYTALQNFLQEHGTETRLLAQGSDRTLTNLHQILEILAAEDENGRAPSVLHQWFGQQICAAQNGHAPQGETLLRLESDENLVKIVTMHASKGLQYPIVYCPFAWKTSGSSSQKWHIIHHGTTSELVHKDQLSESDQQQYQNEQLSEDLRLLYVALTRAEEQLNLYLGSYRDSKNSALAYLLDCQNDAADAEKYAACWQKFLAAHANNTDFVWQSTRTLPRFSGCLKRSSALAKTQKQPEKTIYRAESYPPRPYQFVQHTSFTALARQSSQAHADSTQPTVLDIGEQTAATPAALADTTPPTIAQFPQGAAAGICLHAILEKYRFDQSSGSQQDLLRDTLTRHGFGSEIEIWQNPVAEMLEHTAHAQLLPHASLATLNPKQMLPEADFLLHTEDFGPADIRSWFAQQGALSDTILQAAQQLDFRSVHGFLSGFIDQLAQTPQGDALIIDYKSNYLGGTPSDYTADALDAAVAEHHYYLQAFIYAVAAARYLAERRALPDTLHIRYLFLRGLQSGSSNGIWSWDIATQDLKRWL